MDDEGMDDIAWYKCTCWFAPSLLAPCKKEKIYYNDVMWQLQLLRSNNLHLNLLQKSQL